VIGPSALPPAIRRSGAGEASRLAPFPTLDGAAKDLIEQALADTNGRKMAAAELLGVERRKLNRMIHRLDVDIPEG
jgi:DNA-binding NtrC family response regulator